VGTDRYRPVVGLTMALLHERLLRAAAGALLLATLSACEGNDEASVRSERSPASVTTTSVDDAVHEAGVATGSVDDPNVFVNVTNQSYDDPDVHVTISVAAQVFVDQNFPVKGQHHVVEFELSLPPGEHQLEVTSDTGVEHLVPVSVSEDDPVYVHLAYWDIGDEEPYFHSAVGNEPFGYG
jgi:hypothetical protein